MSEVVTNCNQLKIRAQGKIWAISPEGTAYSQPRVESAVADETLG
jgi:hypothetical protein